MARTDHDWHNIFKLQQASQLNVEQFCTQHHISRSSFYKNKQRLLHGAAFIKAQVKTQTRIEQVEAAMPITLQLNIGLLQLPTHTSASYLAELINGLSK